jgi:hypothetical protein
MKRDEVFPSKYLKAADLGGKPRVVTIERALLETLKNPEGKEQAKTVLYFAGSKKMLPLNRINWDAVAAIAGDDTEDWPGARIELYPTTTEMAGKIVDCIRIRAPSQAAMPLRSAKPAPAAAKAGNGGRSDLDDAVPF